MESKYCLVQDDDCHWYVIPVDRQKEFSDWLYRMHRLCVDERLPSYADMVGGSPSLVEFQNYDIR
jgi:hypothetical protein